MRIAATRNFLMRKFSFKSFLLGLFLFLGLAKGWGQTNLFTETFGTTNAVLPTGWTSSNTTNGWNGSTASASSTYTGASGGANALFNGTGTNGTTHTLTYSNNLSTVGYSSITILWGGRGTTAFNGTIVFQWSSDGTTWNNVSYTYSANGNAWALVNSGTKIALPSGASGQSNLRLRWSSAATNNGNYRIDDVTVEGTSSSTPTKLAITSISPTSPIAGSTFSVTVQSQDGTSTASNVVATTGFTLSNTGGGSIGGTTTGSITAGTNQVVVSGVTLSTDGTGVTLTATRTSGDALTAGTSSSFTVLASVPSVASSVVGSNRNTTTMDVGWTNGGGTGRIVVARLNATTAVAPTVGTTYTPSATGSFTGSTTTGTGNIVVYNGTGSTVSITNLTAATAYAFDVYEYNGTGSTTNYSAKASSASTSTLSIEPSVQANSVTFSSLSSSGFTINFNAGTGGSGRLVVVRQGSAVDFVPVDGTAYTANTLFTSGTGLGPSSDNKVVLASNATSVGVTGLTANTLYYVAVYEFNGSSTTINYLTTTPATGNKQTLATKPTANAGTPTFANTTTSSFDVNWTAASPAPDGYIVIRRSGANTPDNPVDGTGYIAGDAINSSTVVYVGNSLTVAQSSLSAGTEYRYRVFSYNGSGAGSSYLLTGVSSGINFTLSLEPLAHPASFTATAASSTSINLAYSAANTITNASGYLILQKIGSAPTGTPTDGQSYANGATIGDGTVAATETNAAAVSRAISSLSSATNYYYAIIPFGWDGTNNATKNYYTAPTILTANATTVSASSDVVAVPASSPASISSLINDPAPLTSSTGIQVWQITIQDGGASLNDLDLLPTKVSGITFTAAAGNAVTWNTAIKTAALFDGSTLVATATSITASSIIFSGLTVSVADNTSKTLSLKISLNETLGTGNDDGDDFQFQLSQGNFTTVTDGTSSEKNSSFPAISTANNIENVIAVVATKLAFVQQPSSTTIGVAISPSVTISGVDVNGNLDLDFVASVALAVTTGSATYSGATSSVNAVAGIATFSNLVFGAAATGNKLTASSTGITSSLESSAFDVNSNPTVGLQISATNTTYTIDFDNTLSGVNNGAFTGAGFNPTASLAAGQLNSDAWAVTGWSDGDLAFGASNTTGDYARGASAGGVTTGGTYGFDVDVTAGVNRALGFQPGGNDWAPGTLTLRMQNATGAPITSLSIAYKVYINNDQARSNSFNFSYSTNNSSYTTANTDADIASIVAADALSWKMYYRVIKITGLNIPATGYYYLRWSGTDVSGTGSRDEFALDDIVVIANPTSAIPSFAGDILNAAIAGDAVASGNVTGLSNLTVASNGSLDGADKTFSFAASSTASIKGVLKTANLNGLTGSTSTTIVSTNSPTVTLASGSTIEYNASSGTQTVTSRSDYRNLTISNAATKPLSGNATINEILNLSTDLSIAGNTLTLAGTVTGSGSLKGSAASNVSITGTSALGTLKFDQTTDGTTNILSNLTINRTSSGSVTLGNKLVLIDVLTPTAGTLNTGGFLHLRSTATNTARIAPGASGGNYISGDVTVERYISSSNNRAYRLLAPMVTTSTSINANWQEGKANSVVNTNLPSDAAGYGTHITGSGGSSNGFDATQTNQGSLYTYTYNPDAWTLITNTNVNTLNAGTGYLLFVRGNRDDIATINTANGSSNTTLRAKGTLTLGDQTLNNLSSDGNVTLIANPFASPIRWDASSGMYTGNNATNFENYITIWDPNIGSRGGFVTVNTSGTTGGGATNLTRDIQSGQAFFIQAKVGIMSPSLSITENNKSTTNNLDVYRAGTQTETLKALLYYTDNTGTVRSADGVTSVFNNGFSNSIDGEDAQQIDNWDEDVAITRDNKFLSIEARKLVDAADTIQLAIARFKTQAYQWKLVPDNFNAPGLTAFLKDNFAGISTPISLSDTTVINFTATADPASKAANRFSIVFKQSSTLPVTISNIKAYAKNSGVQVEWQSSNEINIARYEVEKSSDAIHFTKLATLVATGANNYNSFDAMPITGNNFYRIKIVESTGNAYYSPIAKVTIGKAAGQLVIYPNPIVGNQVGLQINELAKGNYQISITNAIGQTVYTQNLQHAGGALNENLLISKQLLSAGVYQIKLEGGESIRLIQTFLKQ